MLELHLQRSGTILEVTFGEHNLSIPLAEIVLNEAAWELIYEDATAYGRKLFEQTFRDEQLRITLASLPANERLMLVADDPLVAAIPWEYLRDQNDKLLASRLSFVRGVPDAQRRDGFTFAGALEIVAIPVSPVDEQRVLNVEREWKNLIEAVSSVNPPKTLMLKHLRPPTRAQMGYALSRQSTSIVHFMGHSTSRDGKAFLGFEDARACTHLVDAADFADSLNAHVFLVVLNSCLSATVSTTTPGTVTAFGNIAHELARRGFSYALGMQFELPDAAALVLSPALYGSLLQGYSVEEAVVQTRRVLEEPGKLPNPHWLAGVPVLYTSLRTPAAPVELTVGQSLIQPDPERLQKTCDLTALPQAEHFVGRGNEISETLDALLAPGARGFVLLHGLGGIGKTSLARAVAERIGWHYQDRVLAYSFETFASVDAAHHLTVNEQFADSFSTRLARFYDLDPTDAQRYPTVTALQQAIIQKRAHLRSLLVLDNIETLIDAQKRDHPAARALASFVSRLREGDGAILLTSRIVPPADWGEYRVVSLSGLADEAGAELFLALLPADREHLAPPMSRLELSQLVQGYPLSIHLLAGRFADETTNLATFLSDIEAELEAAEQTTPTSLEDPERQRTLYACMDYSVKRLTPEQRQVLDAVTLFQAPFLPAFAAQILNNAEQTPMHLQSLVRLGLLNIDIKTFKEGELILLDMHPMLRWYIGHQQGERDAALRERYGEVYMQLAWQSCQPAGGYDQSSLMRYLVRQSLPDCEAALQYLPSASKSTLAYHLAQPYRRLGQNRRALTLYELALEIVQELGELREVALTQHAMADVLRQRGRPQEAIALFEQSLRTIQELGDLREVALTQHAMADVLSQQGKLQEAMVLYEQSLRTTQELGDLREVAVTQSAMANVLSQQGKAQEAITLYEQSLRTTQELGDLRGVAITQANFSQLLLQQGEHDRAIHLAWEAYTSLSRNNYTHDAQIMQKSLIAIKGEALDPERFDLIWKQVVGEPQPSWLRDVQESVPDEQDRLSAETLNVVVSDTVAVMTQMPEKLAAWRETMGEALKLAQNAHQTHTTEFFTAILALLDGQAPKLPRENPYAEALNEIQDGMAAGGPQDDGIPVGVSGEVMQAVRDFVNAEDWDATRQVVEAQQTLLFRPEVEALFEQNIAQARAAGEQHAISILEQHLAILLDCQEHGIAEAFEQLVAAQEDDLPFDEELIPRSIAALLGGPQEKLAHAQYLTAQAAQTMDDGLKTLITTLQLALFSSDLSQLGRELQGVYRQAWEAIVVGVETGGVDPRLFDAITNNTLAVLGSASNRRSEWRNDLVEMRNAATVQGARHLVTLLDAVIGLLDAGGNPAGLGEGLTGVYAKTWQKIVEQLPT